MAWAGSSKVADLSRMLRTVCKTKAVSSKKNIPAIIFLSILGPENPGLLYNFTYVLKYILGKGACKNYINDITIVKCLMDVLFATTPVTVEERYGRKVGNVGGYLPPLGLATVASYVREKGYSVDLIDTVVLKTTEEDLLTYLRKHRPKVFAVTAITVDFQRATSFCERVRQGFPEMLIVIGGVHANLQSFEIMEKHKCYDLLVYGTEGELTFEALMNSFRAAGFNRGAFLSSNLAAIKGIVFRKDGKAVKTEPMPIIENLDVLPFPARDLLPMDKYLPLPNQYLRPPVASMVVSRGCIFKCTFCNEGRKAGFRMRFRSPKLVVDEIQHLMETYGTKEISFWDDTFSGNPAWTVEVCKEINKRGLDIVWSCYCNILGTTEEMLGYMAKAGCWNIFYGIESGNEDLLLRMRKGLTLDRIRQIVKFTKQQGIEIRASFMLGVPGETPEKGMNTIKFAIELEPDYAQFSLCTPYPGTELWENASNWGKLVETDYAKYHGWEAVWLPEGYQSKAQLLELEKLAMRMFYLRPKFIWNKIRKIRSFEDIVRYAKGARLVAGFT